MDTHSYPCFIVGEIGAQRGKVICSITGGKRSLELNISLLNCRASALSTMNFLQYEVCLLNGETSIIRQSLRLPSAVSSSYRYKHTEALTCLTDIKTLRHYFANKGLSSQTYGFSGSHVWMSELDHKESWVLKNWCFWTMVLEKALESPLDCKEIQPVHPKEISPALEGLILKLKLQYFGHLMRGTDSLEKTLMLNAGEGDDRGWDGWMASPAQWIWVWASSGNWRRTEKPGVLRSMGSQRVRQDWATELNWTEAQRANGLVQRHLGNWRQSQGGNTGTPNHTENTDILGQAGKQHFRNLEKRW